MTLKYPQRKSEKVCFRETFINDTYVQDNGGTITASPTVANGVTTNGSTQYINYGNACNLGSGSWTISTKFSMPVAGVQTYLFSKHQDNDNRWYLRVNTNGSVFMYCVVGSAVKISATTSDNLLTTANKEYTVTVVGDRADTIKFYIDGVLATATVATFTAANLDNTGDFEVGRWVAALGAFTMRDLTIQNVVSSTEEVLDYYQRDTFKEIDASKAVMFLPCRSTFGKPSGINVQTDGDMELDNTTYWPSYRDAVVTKVTASPHSGTRNLRVAYGGQTTAYARQDGQTVGKRYKVTGWARGDGGTGIPKVQLDGYNSDWTGTNSTSWQYVEFYKVPVATGLFLVNSGGAGTYVEFDDMSVELAPIVTENIGTGAETKVGDGSTTSTFPAQLTPHGFQFAGVGDYLTCAGAPAAIGDVTIGAMIKLDSWAEQIPRIFYNGSFVFAAIKTNSRLLLSSNGGGAVVYSATNSIQPGKYYFVVVTRKSDGTCNFYINGQLSGTADQSSGIPDMPLTSLIIGSDKVSRGLYGSIDTPFVFNSILTPTQIKELANQAFNNLNV